MLTIFASAVIPTEVVLGGFSLVGFSLVGFSLVGFSLVGCQIIFDLVNNNCTSINYKIFWSNQNDRTSLKWCVLTFFFIKSIRRIKNSWLGIVSFIIGNAASTDFIL